MVVQQEIIALEKLLKGSFGKNWNYVSYSTTTLIAPGENYGSLMLKLDVEYEENNNKNKVNLVAKMCPPSDILKEAFACSVTFRKEILAYTDLCPLIEKIQIDYNIPETERLDFFAKCYGARMNLKQNDKIDNDAVIILENLKIKQYFVEDRFKGLDLPTAQLVLKNLAKLHATVIAIRMLLPAEFKQKVLPSLETINNGGVMVDGFVGVGVKMLETIEECKPYWEKVKKMIEERKKLNGLIFPVETNSDFYTIVHTDFWTNNMMILKNDKGDVIDVKMVDLQLTAYGTGIRDLLFFLYSSVEIDVCNKYFDNLISLYYNTFVTCLNNFNCDTTKFSWNIFQKELTVTAPHELYHILFMLKPIFSERGSVESLENIDVKDFGRTDNIGEPYFKKLKQVVLSYVEKKWI